jgi:hypothetical protein
MPRQTPAAAADPSTTKKMPGYLRRYLEKHGRGMDHPDVVTAAAKNKAKAKKRARQKRSYDKKRTAKKAAKTITDIRLRLHPRTRERTTAWSDTLGVPEIVIYRALIYAVAADPPAGPVTPLKLGTWKPVQYTFKSAVRDVELLDATAGRHFYAERAWLFEWALVERAELVGRILRLLPGEVATLARSLYTDTVEVSPCEPMPLPARERTPRPKT